MLNSRLLHLLNQMLISLVLAVCTCSVPAYAQEDIVDIPFEKLLQTEVITAEKIAQQVSDAPSAVSIVTAQDIHDYGYRNLSDVLNSMRGLTIVSAGAFSYLGGRGYAGVYDLSGHVMILIDGNSIGDNFFNRVLLGNDSIIDVAMIDRVEYIPGPVSSSYGSGAFFGVINIITKKGQALQDAQIATGFGSAGEKTNRLSFGRKLENGADILISASTLSGRYLPLYDPNLEPLNDTFDITELSKDANSRLFVKAHYDQWSLELLHSESSNKTQLSLGNQPYQNINANNNTSYLCLNYDTDIGQQLKSSTHAYYGEYQFDYAYVLYNQGSAQSIKQSFPNRWVGIDQRFVGNWFDHHQIVLGASYRNDYRQQYTAASSSTLAPEFDFRQTLVDTHLENASVFIQDEYQALEDLKLNLGVRYDKNSKGDHNISPRLAALWQVLPTGTLKLSYGRAFRNQNGYDLVNSLSSEKLPPEQVSTTELVWQQQLGSATKLIASLYQYKMTDAINKPYQQVDTHGQELELEHVWDGGTRVRASYAHQVAIDDSDLPRPYSPRNIGKLNLSVPLLSHRLNAGVEVQYVGNYSDYFLEQPLGGQTLTNFTLSSASIFPNLDASLTIRNLFQAKDITAPGSVEANRSLWLQLEYAIK